ncbi:MAG: hypothetical protein L0207_03495 [Chlamydiae bacterium]|nr:hypothetical protein [Chlamydiota bacterium]
MIVNPDLSSQQATTFYSIIPSPGKIAQFFKENILVIVGICITGFCLKKIHDRLIQIESNQESTKVHDHAANKLDTKDTDQIKKQISEILEMVKSIASELTSFQENLEVEINKKELETNNILTDEQKKIFVKLTDVLSYASVKVTDRCPEAKTQPTIELLSIVQEVVKKDNLQNQIKTLRNLQVQDADNFAIAVQKLIDRLNDRQLILEKNILEIFLDSNQLTLS